VFVFGALDKGWDECTGRANSLEPRVEGLGLVKRVVAGHRPDWQRPQPQQPPIHSKPTGLDAAFFSPLLLIIIGAFVSSRGGLGKAAERVGEPTLQLRTEFWTPRERNTCSSSGMNDNEEDDSGRTVSKWEAH